MNWNPLTWFKQTPRATPTLWENTYHARMIAKADNERALYETALNYGAPYDLINPWSSFYDGLKLLFPLLPARFDSRISQSYIYLSQTQLDLLRSYSRWLYEVNPYAQAALESLADYCVGTGYKYNVSSRRHANAPKSMLKLANKFIEDFANSNKWWQLERQLYINKKRDGDVALRYFPQDTGITEVRVVTGEQIRDDEGNPETAFGVHCDPDDPSKPFAFKVWYGPSAEQQDLVPASDMAYLKNHTDRSVRRGLSDFFCVHELLYDSANLNRAGRQGEAVRQAIAYVEQFASADAAAVQSIVANERDFDLSRFSSTSANVTEPVHKVMPGEVIRIPANQEFQPPPVGNSANMEVMLNASLRAAAVKWRIPAWILTGDVDANFASALVAESPAVKRFEWDQFTHIKDYCNILTSILQIGIDQGILPQNTLEVCEITAEGAPIATRQPLQETQINSILVQNGIMSKRTWAARENLDFDAEQDMIRDEPQEVITNPARTPSTTPGAEYARETDRGNLQ